MAQLEGVAEQQGVSARYATAPERFAHLLRILHARAGQRVVVLRVRQADSGRAGGARARDYLRGLYGVIKDSDAHVRFAFLTGITKFSKVNLFSQLNNLTDLTLDPVYSICGSPRPTWGRCSPRNCRPGPGADPRVVQRLWLAGRG